jgi:hypothetical protein
MFTERLSKHFILLDFLAGHTLYTSGRPLHRKEIDRVHIDAGVRLCENLLEPITERFGPISIANGFIPNDLLSRPGPHQWLPAYGAAADIAVHNWVNVNRAPIHFVEELMVHNWSFDRFISYAGSEFLCMSTGRQPADRSKIYENIRVPGEEKPRFVNWYRGGRALRQSLNIPQRPHWRRMEDEPVYHTMRKIRAQHIRVGRYFTFLDFCRNERAIAKGSCWVPPLTAQSQPIIQMARCMAEILDPVAAAVGRVSVVRGVLSNAYAMREPQTWTGKQGAVWFMLPEGAEFPPINHPAVESVVDLDQPDGSTLYGLLVNRFQPTQIWSSGIRPRIRP